MQINVFRDITNSSSHLNSPFNVSVKRVRSIETDTENTYLEPALKRNNIFINSNNDVKGVKNINKQKNAVNIISSWYLVISRKNKMKKYSNAVKIIERYRYGKKIKRLYRRALIKQQLLMIKSCVIKIQQWYRYIKERKKRLGEIKLFLEFQNLIIHFQAHIRGRNVRKRKLLNEYSLIADQNQSPEENTKSDITNNNLIEISNIIVDPLLGVSRLSLAIQQLYNNNNNNNNNNKITPLSTPTAEMMRQFNELDIDKDENENDDDSYSYKHINCYSPTIHLSTHTDNIITDDYTIDNTNKRCSIWDEVIDKAIDSSEGIINKSNRICWKYDLINDDEEKERHEPNPVISVKPIYHSPSPQTKRTLESQLKLLKNQEKRKENIFTKSIMKNKNRFRFGHLFT